MKTEKEIRANLDLQRKRLESWEKYPNEDPDLQTRLVAGYESSVQQLEWVLGPSHEPPKFRWFGLRVYNGSLRGYWLSSIEGKSVNLSLSPESAIKFSSRQVAQIYLETNPYTEKDRFIVVELP